MDRSINRLGLVAYCIWSET